MSVKQRLFWPDLIRVIAIFLMVVLHVSASYVPLWNEQSVTSWWGANLFDSFSRMCVPLFFMLSGSLLLGKKESLKNFYSKRLSRLLKPWMFWSLIYGVLNFVQNNEASSIKRLVVGTVWTGFWILPVLLVMYLIAPLFSYLIRKFDNYFLIPFISLMGVILLMGIHLPLYFEYSFYFVLGFVIVRNKVKKVIDVKKILVFSLLGVLFSWVIIAVMTYNLSVLNKAFVATYYHYNTWPVMLLSVFGFMSLKYLTKVYKKKIKVKRWFVKVIMELSKASFGIYFIHMLIFRTGINIIHFPSYFYIPLISGLLYVVSFYVIRYAMKVPYLKEIVG